MDIFSHYNNNEYLQNSETFETFVLKKLGQRPGKRIVFPDSKAKLSGQGPQRELLSQYLQQMKDRELLKLQEK